MSFAACSPPLKVETEFMLLFREKIPADWLPKVLANIPAFLWLGWYGWRIAMLTRR